MTNHTSLGRQWLLRIGIFLLILLIAVSACITGLFASIYVYNDISRTEADSYWIESVTRNKTYQVMDDYIHFGWGTDAMQLSKDFRGRTNFQYRIYNDRNSLIHTTAYRDGDYSGDISVTLYCLESNSGWSYGAYTSKTDLESAVRAMKIWYEENKRELGSDFILEYETYTITGYYHPTEGVWDIYTVIDAVFDVAYPMRYLLPVIALAGVILLMILFWRLALVTGYRKNRDGVVLSILDRLPGDLYLAVLVGLGFLSLMGIFLLPEILYRGTIAYLFVCLWFLCVIMLPVLFIALFVTITARIKARTFLKNTLVWRILAPVIRLLRKGIKYVLLSIRLLNGWCRRILTAIPLFWQVAVIAPVLIIGYGLFTLFCIVTGNGITVLIWIFATILFYVLVLYAAYSFRILMQSGKALAEGNLRYKTDTKNLMFAFRTHGEHLNRIGEGMEIALSEKIRSERFKTELITNVSHDIKTPLTSIINYTDLLSKEPMEDSAREYTEVIIRQSARLKKLIEDLIEASKASTGNMAVAMERLDICQIVRQSVGEYEERLESRGLRMMVSIPEDPVYVMADGRLLWRVLDNLYSNVYKYALEGTRVYVVVCRDGTDVSIVVKNISRDILTTDVDELTERFVQGDASRSAEGSGLGLNIAKSLTELQNGVFRITCDGDLFRADVIFGICS